MKRLILAIAVLTTAHGYAVTIDLGPVNVQTGTVIQADTALLNRGRLLMDGDNNLRMYDGVTTGGLDTAYANKIVVKTTAVNYTAGKTDSRELKGGLICVTATEREIYLPAVEEGMNLRVTAVGNITFYVFPNGSDNIYIDGISTGGGSIVSSGSSGDTIELYYMESGKWLGLCGGTFSSAQ